MLTRFVRFLWRHGQYWGTHEGESVRRWSGAPYDGGHATERTHPISEVTWLPPVVPSKIVAVGLNYAAHVAESASADSIPNEPVLFLKPPSSLLAPGAAILLPPNVDRVDYEGELAVVIGKRVSRVDDINVSDVIAGWTIANDVTARNLQKKDRQWTRAKGFDTFCPVGPWVQSEFDWAASQLTTEQNGTLRQSASFDQMIVSVERLIVFIAGVMTLQPGDLILTGTPAGVGPMAAGDTITISIDGLGSLSNTVANRS